MFLKKCEVKFYFLFKKMCETGTCHLINIQTNNKILLPHLKPVILGRNPLTAITDLFISKQQIICYSNINERKVMVKVIGSAKSCCNGLALLKNVEYTVDNQDILDLRVGHHKFRIEFDGVGSPDRNECKKPKLDTSNTVWHTLMSPSRSLNAKSTTSEKIKPSTSFKAIELIQSESFKQNDPIWEEIDNKELLIYTSSNCLGKQKIASFDIDGTIIKTKSGARFPKDVNDWAWNIGDIKSQLTKLNDKDYKLVFFTNQSGVGKDLNKIKEYKKKIENIINALKLPIQVFVSLGHKNYRKPRTGMWDVLVKDKNEGVAINMNKSFYVGDAAGREKNWAPKRKKDHSMSDRLFALNIGLKFHTPEEYFCKQTPAKFKMPDFDPRISTSHLTYPNLEYDKQNVVLMVGGPGSGKSYFVKNYLIPKSYFRINRDELGSWQKCIKVMEDALNNRKSIVIDNVNVDKVTRQKFIETAKKHRVDVRCFVMETSLTQMRHNNKFRELTDKSHAIVTDIIIYSYKKRFEQPELNEGYTQILNIPFIMNFANNESHEKLYKTFLLD